jgi:hypothetical protein
MSASMGHHRGLREHLQQRGLRRLWSLLHLHCEQTESAASALLTAGRAKKSLFEAQPKPTWYVGLFVWVKVKVILGNEEEHCVTTGSCFHAGLNYHANDSASIKGVSGEIKVA